MYKYCDNNDKYISLHDCRATRILYKNGIITFLFEDGIWIADRHSTNKLGKIVRTDMAEVKFELALANEADITIYMFKEKGKKTIREEWSLSRLIDNVNNRNCTLEFLYQYRGTGVNVMIVECCLRKNKKPYHIECELKLLLKDIKYCWNKLREDSE